MAQAEPAEAGQSGSNSKPESKAESLKLIAGLVAVTIATAVVGAIAIIALLKGGEKTSVQIASSAGGVIATMVGAYFGVKIGSDQTKTALDAQKEEAAKANVFALHVPKEEAREANELAERAARNAVSD